MGSPFTLLLPGTRSCLITTTELPLLRYGVVCTLVLIRLYLGGHPPVLQYPSASAPLDSHLYKRALPPLHPHAFTSSHLRVHLCLGTRWHHERCKVATAAVRPVLCTRARSPLQRCEVVFGKVLFPFGGVVVHKSGCLFVRSEDLTSL